MRCAIIVLGMLSAARAAEPIAAWRFDAAHAKGNVFRAIAGERDARVFGPVKFADDKPAALLIDGDSKARRRIFVSEDLSFLPRKAITVEAFVQVDKSQEWGGIAGAFQDNGSYERGWLLGYNHRHFFFAVATTGGKKLTYLNARAGFEPGAIYHVVGTYDGREMKLFIDGRQEAVSREQSGDIQYPPTGSLTLGAYHDDNEMYSLNGRLAEVSLFDAALSAEQLADRFKSRAREFPGILPEPPRITDWPMYLRDPRRRGIVEEPITLPLRPAWIHQARFGARPAWPDEKPVDFFHKKYEQADRVVFDCGFHVVAAGGRVWFASSADDSVTCLDAATGRTHWRFVAEGPIRLAPTIDGDRVLFGSDDGYVYCLAAKDGALRWKTRIADAERRIAGNERIISPVPVRTDVYIDDGSAHVCAGVFASEGAFRAVLDPVTGQIRERAPLAVSAQGYQERSGGQLFVGTGRNLAGAFVTKLSRRGKEPGPEVKKLSAEFPYAFVGAGDVRFAGGDNVIAAFAADDGRKLWSTAVQGKVWSLAILRGSLLACTDKGVVYCFTPNAPPHPMVYGAPAPVFPALDNADARLVETLVRNCETDLGYALMLGSSPAAAVELARRTNLRVVLRTPDAELAETARSAVDAAGLGDRLSVHVGPLSPLPYSDYLFNLVYAGSADRAEATRVTRPSGGATVLADTLVLKRPPVEGAGDWTHQYAEPGNTSCSRDQLVSGDLRLQWFGPPGPLGLIDRHHRGPAPVYAKGRLFLCGEDRVLGIDAYNGTILWDRKFPGSRRVIVLRDGSPMALSDDLLYLASGDNCLAIDPQTGITRNEIAIPGTAGAEPLEWSHLTVSNDVIIGSATKAGSTRREQSHKLTVTETHWDFVPLVCSDRLFAIDRRTGRPLWVRPAVRGPLINPSITVSDGRVFVVESFARQALAGGILRLKLEDLVARGSTITAIDLRSGRELWTRTDPTMQTWHHNVFGIAADGRLAIVGTRNTGTDKKRDHVVFEIRTFDARTGAPGWTVSQQQWDFINGDHGEQDRHPALVGRTLYVEPRAYDWATGRAVGWQWPWMVGKNRRGCGSLSASANGLFFRDETLNAFPLTEGKVRKVTAETRPGCWINVIPAGGLLLAPEASSGCSCNHAVQTSLGMIPVGKPK